MDGGKEEVDVLGLEVEGAAGTVLKEGLDQFAFSFLELIHTFLDGADGEEAIDEDGFFLTDAMGAVHGLGFDGRVPPGIVKDDGIGGGQVESRSAGLEADEEQGHFKVLELSHGCGAVVGIAGEEEVREMEGVEALPDQGEHGGELGEEEDATAFLEERGDELDEVVEFGGGMDMAGGFERHQAWVAADLAEFKEGIEDDDLGALQTQATDLVSNALFHGQADGFVEVALGGGKFDLANDLGFWGKFLGHLVLASAEEEGADTAGEFLSARLVLVAFDGVTEVGAEGAFVSEETG